MRILFSSHPAFGHVFPLMPLALAARAGGHEVVFATGPEFLPRLARWGFDARKAGESLDWAFERTAARYPELLENEDPGFGAAMFVEVLGMAKLDPLRKVVEEARPDLVVYEATDVAAAIAAASADVPAVCHAISLWMGPFRAAILERVAMLWEKAGREVSVDPTLGDLFLDIWPPSMQSPDARTTPKLHRLLRPVPWSDPESSVPQWIGDAKGPLVFVSLGTVFWGKQLLQKVIEGLSALDVDALVLAGADATPDELPAEGRVRVAGFVDQPAVLRHADAVVHHGGAGTLLASLSNGLPQLVLPQGADRPYTAASLVQAGAGISVEPHSASADSIAGALTKVLEEPVYRERAESLREEIAGMPSPGAVVAEVEALAR